MFELTNSQREHLRLCNKKLFLFNIVSGRSIDLILVRSADFSPLLNCGLKSALRTVARSLSIAPLVTYSPCELDSELLLQM